MSVYLRGKTWYINVTLGGYRLAHSIPATSARQAHEIQSELKTRFRLGLLNLHQMETVRLFRLEAEIYFNQMKRGRSPKTYIEAKRSFDKHVNPVFQEKTIQGITDKDLLDFQTQKKYEGYSNRSINIFMGIVRKILRHSLATHQISRLDLRFPMLPEPKKHHAFASPDELTKLLNGFDIKGRVAFLRTVFAVNTGLRPKELTLLKWEHVNLDMKIIRVQPIVGKGSLERTIPLNDITLNVLRDLYESRNGEYVFGVNGKPVRSIRTALWTASKNAGIKKISPNMLRHTFATNVLLTGGDVRSLQELMGHTDISTTNRYTHAIQEQLQKTVNALPQIDVAKTLQKIVKNTPK